LDEVQKLSLPSISVPALGTGTLKFPDDLVAKVLFEEAMKFSSKHKSGLKIKQYNVVVYSGNTKAVNIFKEQFQVYSNKKIENEPNVPKTKRKKPRTLGFPKFQTKDKAESSEDETHGVNVEIVQGNIVEESTDAIGFLVAEDITQGKMYYVLTYAA
jgi:poly [ADP-ribose] polymerase 10/14/15